MSTFLRRLRARVPSDRVAASSEDGFTLIEVLVATLIAGVGICIVYAVAVVGITRAQEHRRAERRGAAALYAALATVALAACGWAAVTGIAIMAKK